MYNRIQITPRFHATAYGLPSMLCQLSCVRSGSQTSGCVIARRLLAISDQMPTRPPRLTAHCQRPLTSHRLIRAVAYTLWHTSVHVYRQRFMIHWTSAHFADTICPDRCAIRCNASTGGRVNLIPRLVYIGVLPTLRTRVAKPTCLPASALSLPLGRAASLSLHGLSNPT